jgi:two-component system CheB/CheR fusion protein
MSATVHDPSGQSILSLDIGLPVEQLRGPVRSLLNGDSAHQYAVLDAFTRRGRTIRCGLTCTPLTGAGQGLEGVILLMEEVDESRTADANPHENWAKRD